MQRFEFGALLPLDRQRQFTENVATMCSWPLELLAAEAPFEARAVYARLGDVVVGEVIGAPHGVAYHGRGAAPAESCLIVIPRRTRGHVEYGGRREPLVADQLYLLDDGAQWHLLEEVRFHHLLLKVPRSALPSLREPLLQKRRLRTDAASTTLVAMVKSLVELHIDLDRLCPDSRAMVATTLCGLLDAVLRPDEGSVPETGDAVGARERYHRERIHNYVLTHLADQGLNVESIAHAIGLSPRHVHRLYAGQGMPLMRWIWAERLDRCRTELTRADVRQPISAVAYAWGFSDPAHFSRAFRQRFGISPRAVRGAERAIV